MERCVGAMPPASYAAMCLGGPLDGQWMTHPTCHVAVQGWREATGQDGLTDAVEYTYRTYTLHAGDGLPVVLSLWLPSWSQQDFGSVLSRLCNAYRLRRRPHTPGGL